MMNLKPDEYLDPETNQVRCKKCQGIRRRELKLGGRGGKTEAPGVPGQGAEKPKPRHAGSVSADLYL